jgi:hypothetical protein
MIPIPSYQLLEFFNWMSEQHPRISVRKTSQEALCELALVYIRSSMRDDRSLHETRWSDGGRTRPIDLNPQLLHREAERLAASVKLLARGRFYEEYLEKQPAVLHHLAALGLMTENTAQAIEFLGWLQERYPKIDILANAPVSEIKGLALEFCEAHNYENPLAFSKEVESWLDGRSGKRNIIERLVEIGRQIKTRNQTYNSGVSPFKRYQTIQFHAIFLFLSAGDFPSFIKQYWQDLIF